jgi:hypothetical protein
MSKKTKLIVCLTIILSVVTIVTFAAGYVVYDLGSTYAIHDEDSYVGLLNHAYTEDNSTRLYLLPKDSITTGTGGVLKIFADPFHLNKTDYRDLGIYYFADQKNDKGQWGDGVFWINSKAIGTHYAKNPDIGFSFQDGSVVAGRFVYFQNNGHPEAVFVAGKGASQIAPNALSVKLEVQGDIGLRNNDLIRYVNSSGKANSGLKFDYNDNFTVINKGQTILQLKPTATNRAKLVGSIAGNQKTIIDNSTVLNIGDSNSAVLNNSTPTIITSLGAAESGLEVTLIFANGNTTIQNNDRIKLKDSIDFVGTSNDTLKLITTGNVWYEVSRSNN